MKLYRVTNPGADEENREAKFEWTSSKREAKKLARESRGSVDPIEVPTDRKGLLKFLNDHVWR